MTAGGTGERGALATARELADVLDLLTGRLNALAKAGRQDRRWIRIVAVSVVFDILLSVVVTFLVFGIGRVETRIHASQVQACAIGNQSRAAQRRLWDHVIAVSKAPPHETPAERAARLAQIAAFRGYVARQFRPVSCTRLYGR